MVCENYMKFELKCFGNTPHPLDDVLPMVALPKELL